MRPVLSLGLLLAFGGVCACAAHHNHHEAKLWPGARFIQVATFDGHELWVEYDCAGARLGVRFLGDWADAFTADGGLHRLTRKSAPHHQIDYEGDGYRLVGYGVRPTWTPRDGQPVECHGSI
jgi:hypothetical protein